MLDAAPAAGSSPQSTDSINATTADGPHFRTIRQQLIEPPSEDRPEAKPGASLSTVMFNLLATCLGAGILGLPYGYTGSGFVGGSILLVVCAALSAFGAHLVIMEHAPINRLRRRAAVQIHRAAKHARGV